MNQGTSKGKIKIKTECLFIHDKQVLAGKGHDYVKNEDFYRVVGGTINFGETAEMGIRREIFEELGCEVENLELVDVIENIFTYEGIQGHEIVFLFKGSLSNKTLYKRNPIHIVEDKYEFDAEWVPIPDILNKKVRFYPEYDYSKILNHSAPLDS